ncbi:hypothetical protein ACP4OV_014389 [Aristida adscensionis]
MPFDKDERLPADEPPVTSKRQPPLKRRYPKVEGIKDTAECPRKYTRGKSFLPNRVLEKLPRGMRMFHDWYLRACATDVNLITARFLEGALGGLAGTVAFDFDDMHTMYRLGYIEMNLIQQIKMTDCTQTRPPGYLDPHYVTKSTWDAPMRWDKDGPQLAAGTTPEEKQKLWKKAMRTSMLEVVVYIERAFKVLEEKGIIYIPFHFANHGYA